MAQVPLCIAPHLTFEEIDHEYRTCKNAKDKSRWHLIWFMMHPKHPRRVTDAAKLVGYCERWARILVGRYNAGGKEKLIDQRKHNKGRPLLLNERQQKKLKMAITTGKPEDGGLWTGPKVAAWIKKETKQSITDTGAWYWIRRMTFTLQVPRPSHVKSATNEEQVVFKKKSKKHIKN
jgi:transposase